MPGAGPGILKTWKPAGARTCGVCAAVDAHDLRTGGARAAAVLAGCRLRARAGRTHRGATRVPPYRPGEFYLRELPPRARSWTT